jgi:hypothetical protein
MINMLLPSMRWCLDMTKHVSFICLLTWIFWAITKTCIAPHGDTASAESAIGGAPVSAPAAATKPGVEIKAPERAASSAPVPLRVTMVADMQTYYANNGLLDKALDIVLIRRDAPGVRFVAKIDPRVVMLPETRLPQPPPGTDLSRAGFIREERVVDAFGFGVRHDGAADYFVVASFAGWLSEPARLAIEDKSHRLPVSHAISAPTLSAEAMSALPSPPMSRGVAAQIKAGPEPQIQGGLRVAAGPVEFPGERTAEPFVTIVAAHLSPMGGVSTGSFLVPARIDGEDSIAQFAIPLTLLLPKLKPGKYRLLVFSGDQYSNLIDTFVP